MCLCTLQCHNLNTHLLVRHRYQPVGTMAEGTVLAAFAELPFPMGFTKGEKVLCQRSSGEWCHAKVHAFENWPPEGGTLTLQVDKYRRKVLDLSKRRHMLRVRVAKVSTAGDDEMRAAMHVLLSCFLGGRRRDACFGCVEAPSA